MIVIDHVEYRLDFARRYCPAEVYNFRSIGDPVVFLKKTTDSLGADVCIDAVGGDAAGSALHTLMGTKLKLEGGSAVALHWAINSVKKGGIVSIVGVYGPTGNLIPIGNVLNKGITIRANQASVKRLLPKLIAHIEAEPPEPQGTDHPQGTSSRRPRMPTTSSRPSSTTASSRSSSPDGTGVRRRR
ncbi:hypothetical protein ACU4GA_11135 [Methylobacterium oryzae CBMB20]